MTLYLSSFLGLGLRILSQAHTFWPLSDLWNLLPTSWGTGQSFPSSKHPVTSALHALPFLDPIAHHFALHPPASFSALQFYYCPSTEWVSIFALDSIVLHKEIILLPWNSLLQPRKLGVELQLFGMSVRCLWEGKTFKTSLIVWLDSGQRWLEQDSNIQCLWGEYLFEFCVPLWVQGKSMRRIVRDQ